MNMKKLFALLVSAAIGLHLLSGMVFAEKGEEEKGFPDGEQLGMEVERGEEPAVLLPEEEPNTVEPEDAPITLTEGADGGWIESAQCIYTMFADSWNGARAEGDSAGTTARIQSNIKYGDSGMALRLRTTNEAGTVTVSLTSGGYFKEISNEVAAAVADESAQLGFWFYREAGAEGDVSFGIDGTQYPVDTAVTGTWQFIHGKITGETKAVTFSISGGDCFVDELGIYMEMPSDITPQAVPVYYDETGGVTSDSGQCVEGYFEIGFNFPVEENSSASVVVENSVTGEAAPVSVTWPDVKTMRINFDKSLEFETAYQAALSDYKNIYGGVLDRSTFAFQTQLAPVKFDHRESMDGGTVSSAQISGTLTNRRDQKTDLTVYALAAVEDQAIAVSASEVSLEAKGTAPVSMTLRFPGVNSREIAFTYFLLDENMMPVNLVFPKPEAEMTVSGVQVLGSVLSVRGGFTPAGGDRRVIAAVTASESGVFEKNEIVSMAQARTEPDGTFLLSNNLFGGLASGDYTVFIWGEGDSASQQFSFYYSGLEDRARVIEALQDPSTSVVLACMEDARNAAVLETLGVIISDYAGLSQQGKEKAAALIVSAPDRSEARLAAAVNQAVALMRIREDQAGSGSALLSYQKYFAFSPVAQALLADVSTNAQGLTELLNKASFHNASELDRVLSGVDMVLLAVSSVQEADRLHQLLVEFKELLGFDPDRLIQENSIDESNIPLIFTAMLGKSYTTAVELQKAFQTAMQKYVEGPPFNGELLSSIFTDSVQGGYTSTWNGSWAAAEAEDNVKVGSKSLYISPASSYSAGVIWRDTSFANDAKIKPALSYDTAYIGMWVYLPEGSGWFEIWLADPSYTEHTRIRPDESKKDCWQYVLTKITQDVQYIMIKTQSPQGIWLDDIKVYSVPPDDPSAAVTAVNFYDRYGEKTEDQNQFIGTYFDVVYNFPTLPSLVSGVELKKKATNETVSSAFTIEDIKTIRIKPDANLEYDTEYMLTIGTYKNVFGGELNGYTVSFKTCLVPMRFEEERVTKGTGRITTASLSGVLCNDDKSVKNLTVYAQAKVSGETTGISYQQVSFENTARQEIMLSVNFPEADSASVEISYFILTDAMLPIRVVVPQKQSALTLEKVEAVGKNIRVAGSFAEQGVRAVVGAVVKGSVTEYDPQAVVTMIETQTDSEGKFEFRDVLYDDLDTGDYTIFVWGESADKVLTQHIFYAGLGDRERVVRVLAKGSQTEITQLLDLEENRFVLQSMGMLIEEYGKLSSGKAEVARYMAELPEASKNSETAAIAQLNSAVVLAYIKETAENPVNILVDYAAYLGIEKDALYLIQSILEDDRASELNSLIKSAGFSNAQQLNNLLKDKLLLMAINAIHSNNHVKMKELLALYEDKVGFDAAEQIEANKISEYSAMRVYQGLINQKFSSLAACKTKFDSLIKQYKPKDNSPGGSSGKGTSSANAGMPLSVPGTAEKTNTEEPRKAGFTDIDGHWAKASIESLYEKGYINGKNDTQFCPEDKVTREEFVKMLLSAFGLTDQNAAAEFSDVSADRWSYSYIGTAAQLGIVNGYPDGSFGPANQITREEMAAITFQLLKVTGRQFDPGDDPAAFSDAERISDYAREAVEQLRRAGILNGTGNNEFMPQNNATRAEAAQIIYSLIK